MPLAPNWIERTLFVQTNQAPGPMLDLWAGPAFQIVHTAIKLDLFGALAAGPLTAAALAERLGCNTRGIGILAEALVRLGYLRPRNAAYALAPMTRKWLLDDGGGINFAPFFRYWGAIMEQFMPRLEESLRSGEPMGLYTWLEGQPEVSRNFQEGMVAIARFVAGAVAKAMPPLPPGGRVLDLGGGHGAYSMALLDAKPDLRAVIFDSPQALASGRAQVRGSAVAARLDFVEGDFLNDTLPTGFDAVLLFNIIHGLSAAENVTLFRRVQDSLNPGGRIAVLEQLHGIAPLPLAEATSHILSVAYYHLLGGQVYGYAEVQEWLEAAGYRDVQRAQIRKASSALITAAA